MDVDRLAGQRAAGLVGEHLHVAREHDEVDVERRRPARAARLGVRLGLGGDRHVVVRHAVRLHERLAVGVVGHHAATSIWSEPLLQRNSRSLRQWLNFETRISVRYGASAAHSSKAMPKRSATGTNAARSASSVAGARELDAHEEPVLGQVGELLALHDVAAVLDQQPGHGMHDAGAVGAGEGEHERRGAWGLRSWSSPGRIKFSGCERCVN